MNKGTTVAKMLDKLETDAKAIGCTMDRESEDEGRVYIDAPTGKAWGSTFNHSIMVEFQNRGGQRWLAQAIADARKDMSMGLVDCDCEECLEAKNS